MFDTDRTCTVSRVNKNPNFGMRNSHVRDAKALTGTSEPSHLAYAISTKNLMNWLKICVRLSRHFQTERCFK